MLRTLVAAGALLAALVVATTPARTAESDSQPRLLVLQPDRIMWTIALSKSLLTWESDPDPVTPATLFQRDLRTERGRVLAGSVLPGYNLASTRDWVVYAARTRSLFAVHHDGSGRVRLAVNLAAPIAGRGERVAWAQLAGDTYRVIVRNMATGKQWLAAELPRCVSTRCFRIDAVTLADGGVVFTRGAIGPQPSFVVRRGFSDPAPTSVALPGDPQPDLAPSSAGALYYSFARGWYRWDFGTRRPRATRFGAADENTVLRYERGYWLTRTVGECEEALQVVRPDGTRSTLATSERVLALARLQRSGCAKIVAVDTVGDQVLSAWRYDRPSSDPYPVGVTLAGLAFSQRYRA